MSQYYITKYEGVYGFLPINITRVNEVLKNHPSASVTSSVQSNSKISDLATKSFLYLFSQNLSSSQTSSINGVSSREYFHTSSNGEHDRRIEYISGNIVPSEPIRFSDFRNTSFMAANVVINPSTTFTTPRLGHHYEPAVTTNHCDGGLEIYPFAGSQVGYIVNVFEYSEEKTVIGYTSKVVKELVKVGSIGGWQPPQWGPNYGYRYKNVTKQIPIYSTEIKNVNLVSNVRVLPGEVVKTGRVLKNKKYQVSIQDLGPDLTVINTYTFTVEVTLGGSSKSETHHFIRT